MKEPRTKYWKCPKCGFLVLDNEYQLIKFEPECRCYTKTGMKWSDFIPKIEDIDAPNRSRHERSGGNDES